MLTVLELWRLLCLVSAVLFAGCIVALVCMRLLRNRYFRAFEEDELMKTTKSVNTYNSIYLTSGDTKKYVKKYVVCKTAFDKYVVCNFTRKFQEITYFVVAYSKNKRVLRVYRVTEAYTGDTSKVVAVPKRCAYVNIVIGAVDGVEINANVIRPISLYKIRLYSFLSSFALFLGLFIVRHLLIEIIGGPAYAGVYFAHFFNYIAVAASFLLSAIGCFIGIKCLRRKNVKALGGGSLEYEFL